MEYRCEATSVAGFIQQLAVAYIGHGYWYYVMGEIPAKKDPARTDRKIIEQYGVVLSKWARARRKQSGLANLQYLRHGHFFILVATAGRNEFFEKEPVIKDVRDEPIKFAGYSIGYGYGQGRWHPTVRIELRRYRELDRPTGRLPRSPWSLDFRRRTFRHAPWRSSSALSGTGSKRSGRKG